MAFTGPIEDRLAIRELYDSYSDAATHNDEEAYLACWSENGLRIGQGAEVRGKGALRAQWRQIWTMIDRMGFFSAPGAIEVTGERAIAHANCREIFRVKSGEVMKVVGRYDDELVREDGQWVFARREYTLVLDERKG